MNLKDLVSEKLHEDIDLGYDVWRADPWDMALSIKRDYPEEFNLYTGIDIENAIRTWRRENAHRYYEDAS
jgi:hypothetical protein